MKKYVCLLLSILMLMTMFVSPAAAAAPASAEPVGFSVNRVESADTSALPDILTLQTEAIQPAYRIASAEGLLRLSELVEQEHTLEGITFYLVCDVDMTGLDWLPIGADTPTGNSNPPKYFAGTLDGQGHVIRNLVYENLGFDDFTSLEYMPQVELTPGNWAKDAVLTEQILQALDTTPDQPDLVFTVSVQGHGKYPTEPVLEDPAVTVTACPDHLNVNAAEYYVNQLREMDQFIGELVQALSQRKEKTILVLYGDHLPALGLEGADMQSGTLFRTGYVIWDNFGLELLNEDLAAYQLSAAVLGRLDISDGYFNGLHQVFRGEASYAQELRLLQYDVLYGQQYLYNGQDPYTATDMTMGMVPIVAQTLEQHGDAWYISGEHFTPYCRVTVNGKALDAVYLSPRLMKLTQDPGTTDVRQVKIEVVDSHNEILSDTE